VPLAPKRAVLYGSPFPLLIRTVTNHCKEKKRVDAAKNAFRRMPFVGMCTAEIYRGLIKIYTSSTK